MSLVLQYIISIILISIFSLKKSIICSDDNVMSINGTPNALKRRRDDNGQDVKRKAGIRKELKELTLTNAEATGARQFKERHIIVGSLE